MNKFLVILTGSPRGGLKTWNSLFKNIIDPLNADLAICFGNKFLKKDNFFLVQKATFDWTFEEPNNWSTYYQDNYSKKAIDFLISGSDYGMAGGIDDNTGSGAIVSALKDIIYKNHIEIIEDYDFIINTRADQYYVDKLTEIKDNEILIPKGEDYFGICDRFILFNSKFAKSYFSLCNFLENAQDKNLSPDFVTPESVLLSHLKNENLFAVAGIGNPENFFDLLSENNLNISKKFIFPDHYEFNKTELLSIIKQAEENNCKIIITEKDYHRIKKYNFDGIEYLKLKLEIDNKDQLINKIFENFAKSRHFAIFFLFLSKKSSNFKNGAVRRNVNLADLEKP